MTADYEEQVLITGVKKNQHCPICTVPAASKHQMFPASKKGNKGQSDSEQASDGPPWPKRTHQGSQRSIKRFEEGDFKQESDEFVHPYQNFAWKHHHLNIHEAIAVDILHQLHTGVVRRVFDWIIDELNYYGVEPKVEGEIHHITDQLRAAFQKVEPFFEVKVFKGVTPNDLKQWTGADSKALIRQLVAVLTPLF